MNGPSSNADPMLQRSVPWPALLVLAGVLALFFRTGSDMVTIWIRSETFTHAFLVPPISAWLAWRRRELLRVTPATPMPWALVPIALTCLLWLLGELAAVDVVSQFAMVTLIVLAVPALFGLAITRQLAFPLAFLYFSVPFGEFLVPQLMDWTADFTVAALRATGIPVYREGLQFVIPTGRWSVVQACSGVRYLIASFMVGSLYAYLNYQSLRRRLLFLGVAIAVPIIANWARAYMIVMIGHLSGNELAVGVDHLVYGWLFFGVVIGIMFMIGARWAEPEADSAGIPVPTSMPGRASSGWATTVGIIGIMAVTQMINVRLGQADEGSALALALPGTLAQGWAADESWEPAWRPGYKNPAMVLARTYKRGDDTVWLWIGLYRSQTDDSKLVSSINRLVDAEDDTWAQVSRGSKSVSLQEDDVAVRTGEIRQAGRSLSDNTVRLLVWRTYWVGGQFVASDVRAKVAQAVSRLRGAGGDGAVILIATPQGAAADAALSDFIRANLHRIGQGLAGVEPGLGFRPAN